MELELGSYHINVSAESYETRDEWIHIIDVDVRHTVALQAMPVAPAQAELPEAVEFPNPLICQNQLIHLRHLVILKSGVIGIWYFWTMVLFVTPAAVWGRTAIPHANRQRNMGKPAKIQ